MSDSRQTITRFRVRAEIIITDVGAKNAHLTGFPLQASGGAA